MNWGKLKSFLIGLFLIINIFLIITIIVEEKNSTTIPDKTIQDTVNILKRNSINIEPSIIDKKVKNMSDIVVKPVTKSDKFSEKITQKDGNVFEMNFSIGIQNSSDFENVLSDAGIKNYNIEKDFFDGYGSVSQTTEGYTIFEAIVEIESNSNNTSLTGEWYEVQSRPKKESNYQNLVILPSILINYISNEERPIGEQTITDIKYGYYVLNSIKDAVIYTAVPCWLIEVDNAMSFYYNARNGEYIKMLSFQ